MQHQNFKWLRKNYGGDEGFAVILKRSKKLYRNNKHSRLCVQYEHFLETSLMRRILAISLPSATHGKSTKEGEMLPWNLSLPKFKRESFILDFFVSFCFLIPPPSGTHWCFPFLSDFNVLKGIYYINIQGVAHSSPFGGGPHLAAPLNSPRQAALCCIWHTYPILGARHSMNDF